MPITEFTIPYVPTEIDLNDIREVGPNGQLFWTTKNERDSIKLALSRAIPLMPTHCNSKFKIKKPYSGCDRFSVIAIDGEYYLVYPGRKWNSQAGIGSFGVIKYVQHLESGEILALKNISDQHTSDRGERVTYRSSLLDGFFNTEADKLKHANLLHGELTRLSPSKGQQRCLIMSLAKGIELFTFLKALEENKRTLHEIEWLHLILTLCKTVHALHTTHKMVHLDLKPENIHYFHPNRQTTLTDYGFSQKMTDTSQLIKLERSQGTPGFIAPEINSTLTCSTKTDGYSLGATIADIILSQQKLSPTKLNSLNELIFDLANEDPSQRPSMEVVISKVSALLTTSLTNSTTKLNIGILNMDIIKDYNDQQVTDIEKKLASFNEFYFITANYGHDQLEEMDCYLDLLKTLRQRFYFASDRVFVIDNIDNVQKELPNQFKNHPFASALAFTYIGCEEKNEKKEKKTIPLSTNQVGITLFNSKHALNKIHTINGTTLRKTI